jgi:hypothetical protein
MSWVLIEISNVPAERHWQAICHLRIVRLGLSKEEVLDDPTDKLSI